MLISIFDIASLAVMVIEVFDMLGFREQLEERIAQLWHRSTLKTFAEPSSRMRRSLQIMSTSMTTSANAVLWGEPQQPIWNTASFLENAAMANGLKDKTPENAADSKVNSKLRTTFSTP